LPHPHFMDLSLHPHFPVHLEFWSLRPVHACSSESSPFVWAN
jgi:hypothetical protein